MHVCGSYHFGRALHVVHHDRHTMGIVIEQTKNRNVQVRVQIMNKEARCYIGHATPGNENARNVVVDSIGCKAVEHGVFLGHCKPIQWLVA
jgi:hypothetical protein